MHWLLTLCLMCAALVAFAAVASAAAAPTAASKLAPGPQTRKTVRFGLVDTTRPLFPVVLRRADNPHGDITLACEACHTPSGWTPLRETPDFSHDRQTAFPLTGRHEQTTCRSCHLDLRFDQPDVSTGDCASCHLDVHRATLGTDCQRCHTTQDFGTVRSTDVHARTSFPLTGAHLQVSCEACHADAGRDADGAFAPVDPTCVACHAADYAATASSLVDHEAAGFPTTCETCHSTLSFRTAGTFDHTSVSGGFPLLGAHSTLSCASCHAVPGLEPIFQPSGADDCVTCHEDDHQTAHPSFPTTCATCHSLNTFEGATFDHAATTGFPLVGAHQALDCASCHRLPDFEPVFEPTSAEDCATCHADDHQAAHPAFPTTCTTCHGSTSWAASAFDHGAVTGFPLTGVHQPLDCASCHTLPGFEPIFTPADETDCATCHAEDHQTAHPSFPTTCATCHQPNTWEGASFDHGTVTGFPLTGVHTALDCASCHTGGPEYTPIYQPADANDCATCHEDDHQAAHPAFPTTCATCHQPDTWEGATFDHAAATGFPLAGVHTTIACESCHTLPNYEPIYTPADENDCATCHAEDHAAAHPTFPTTCATCHQPNTWAGGQFDHAGQTGFPLVGIHQSVACASCHTGPEYTPIYDPADANDCLTCHETDHQAAHPAFPTTCATCHQPNTWEGASFDHATATGFPLTGVHTSIACESCHTLPDYTPIYTPADENDCATCHEDDHAANHPTFPTTCTTCHQSTTWAGGQFDHVAQTGFPLVGAHQALACSSCHTGPEYTPIFEPSSAEDCLTCHEDDHQTAHPAFPTTCTTCHSTQSWEGASFDHATATGFPLVGVHTSIACESCHTLPDFEPIYTPADENDCATCHEDDHQAAHPTFPTTCTTCHEPNTWEGASFDHGAVTGFPLVGVHAPLGCESCHTLPGYGLIYTPEDQNDCYACHAAEHQANHPTFPQTCTTCHQSTTWGGATFNHATATGFPLVGAHTSLGCESCHTLPDYGPIYNPTNQNDCYACHQADYQAEHAGTGFPTTCLSCHNTNQWEGAQFNHDPFFPIYSGEHEGEWDTCQDCHTTPGNFQIFSCITCHEHRRSEMDDEHEDEDDYVYQSQACFNCHPRGRADDRPGSGLLDMGSPTERRPRFRLVR